jgi:UDP-N-acetylglucosamine 2-epimerase (non-hydrolysing)
MGKKILICFGTRPEYLKLRPLFDKFAEFHVSLFFSGQHGAEIGIPDLVKFSTTDRVFERNRLDDVVGRCLRYFPDDNLDLIIVQGDTATAFGCALAAFHRRIDIAHIEAGLRTQSVKSPYPEEGYRRMISRLADFHFCPTILAAENLEREGTFKNVFVTGNTGLDNLIGYSPSTTNLILVTMHRRENQDLMSKWFEAIESLARSFPRFQFVFPAHPSLRKGGALESFHAVEVIPPLANEEFARRLASCSLVITDSGGIQEEGAFFGKRVVVCRRETERPEGIQTGHLFMASNPQVLDAVFKNALSSQRTLLPCPYGDGFASQKISSILKQHLL